MTSAWAFAGLFLGFLALAAYLDVLDLRIPNRLTAAMAVSGPVAILLAGPNVGAIAPAVLTGALVFAVGWGMFELGWLGGGDAKLATAASLWLGPAATLVFVFATALFGALLAALLLGLRQLQRHRPVLGGRWSERLLAERVAVPYAAAMAPAGVAAMLVRLTDFV